MRYFQLLLALCALMLSAIFPSYSQYSNRKTIAYRATLEKFKQYGAIIVSPDTELVSILKKGITFGKIVTEKEVDKKDFQGLFIIEYSPETMYRSHSDDNSAHRTYTPVHSAGFFLAINNNYIAPANQPDGLMNSSFVTAMRMSLELRETWPMYVSIFDDLIKYTYELDMDISVVPKRRYFINKPIEKKVLEIKEKELLVIDYEAGNSVKNYEAVKKYYPYKYTIVELNDILKAFNNHEKGKMVMVSTPVLEYNMNRYIIDCETHQVLYEMKSGAKSQTIGITDLFDLSNVIKKVENLE